MEERAIITPEAFALANLALYAIVLIALVLNERRGRRITHRWHRHVRTRHISTEEVMRMIDKATKRSENR